MGTDLGGPRIRGRLSLYSEGSGEPSKGMMCWFCSVMPEGRWGGKMEAEGRAERPWDLGAAEKEMSSRDVSGEIRRLGYVRWGGVKDTMISGSRGGSSN